MSGIIAMMNLTFVRLFKLLAFLIVGLLLAAAASLFIFSDDTVSKPKASSFEIIQSLSTIKRFVTDSCWHDPSGFQNNCAGLRERVAELKNQDRLFLVTEQGTLVGVDFKVHVVVLLFPSSATGKLQWNCSVSPPEAAPKLCNTL